MCLVMCARSICGNKIRSLLLLFVCAAAILLLNFYEENLSRGRTQLDALPEMLPVTARITNRSGSRDTGLEIDAQTVQKLRASRYVKDLNLTMGLAGSLVQEEEAASENEMEKEIETEREKETEKREISIVAVNRLEALPEIDGSDVDLAEGTEAGFLEETQAQCLVTEGFLKRNNLEKGQNIVLELYQEEISGQGKVTWHEVSREQLRIAGVISSSEDLPEMAVPFGWAEEICGIWKADSASFSLKLNTAEDLNRFKAQMRQIPLLEVRPGGEDSVKGDSLVVRDEAFLNSAVRIKRNVLFLERFYPVTAALTLLAGYVASWLLAQSQQREYLLLRLQGMKRSRCFRRFILEHFLIALGGVAAAGVILAGAKAVGENLFGLKIFFASSGMFLLCYLAGAAGALVLAGRGGVMTAFDRLE